MSPLSGSTVIDPRKSDPSFWRIRALCSRVSLVCPCSGSGLWCLNSLEYSNCVEVDSPELMLLTVRFNDADEGAKFDGGCVMIDGVVIDPDEIDEIMLTRWEVEIFASAAEVGSVEEPESLSFIDAIAEWPCRLSLMVLL